MKDFGYFRQLALFLLFTYAAFTSVAVTSAEIEDGAVWIDVRSAREYRNGHIEGAINIPHGDIGHKIFQFVPDTFKEVHLYDSNSGTFAGLALELLMEMGFQEVINEGSYEQVLSKQAESDN